VRDERDAVQGICLLFSAWLYGGKQLCGPTGVPGWQHLDLHCPAVEVYSGFAYCCFCRLRFGERAGVYS
jgi:hypothetical protein